MASGDINKSVVMNLAGNLPRETKRYGRAVSDFSRRGQRDVGRLRRSVHGLSTNIARMGNRYTAILSGGGMLTMARQVGNLEERMTSLGVDARLNGDELVRWRTRAIQSVQQTAVETSTRADQIIAAYESIVQKTGDLDFAERVRTEIATTIGATGAQGDAIGELFAEFQKAGLGVDQVREAVAALVGSGQQGSFVLKEMAQLGPRIFAAYNPKSLQGIRDMSAVLQLLRDSSGSSEQATTSFEALFRVLSDEKKLNVLSGAGVKVFDEQNQRRPLSDILKDVAVRLGQVKDAGGNAQVALSQLFPDQEARRGLLRFVDDYLNNRNFDRLDSLLAVQGDFNEIVQDNADKSKDFNRQMAQLVELGKSRVYQELAAPLKGLTDATGKLDPEKVEQFFDRAITGAKVFAAVVVGSKLLSFAGSISRGVGGIARRRGGGLGAAAGVAGATPVWVVNMPGAGLPGMGGKGGKVLKGARASAALAATAPVGTLATAGASGAATVAGGALVAGAAGYGIGSLVYSAIDETRAADRIGEAIARSLAFFGNDNAQAALNRMNGEVVIRVEGPGRVMSMKADGMDLATEHKFGPSLATPG